MLPPTQHKQEAMTMKIEVGKYYRTRDGRKVGPMKYWDNKYIGVSSYDEDIDGMLWDIDGGRNYEGEFPALDLIAEWTEPETGTLAELDVKPGDVVELIKDSDENFVGDIGTIQDDGDVLCNDGLGVHMRIEDECCGRQWRIISRASDAPKTWGEMTDAEKGELLLAEHEGKVIETYAPGMGVWHRKCDSGFINRDAYRIKPEPVRETVTLYGVNGYQGDIEFDSGRDFGDWLITLTTTDGKPDLDSIKMEEV